MTTILLNAVFNPPLEIVHHSGQQLLIDREHFLPDSVLQLVQITGFVSVHTALQIAPRGRNHMMTNMFPCSLGASFRVSAMCHVPQGLLTCHHVISSSGGYLKGRVYTHKLRNLIELKGAIRQKVLTIDQRLLARAMDDFKRRIENCIEEDVRHLNDIIFYT